MRKNFPYNATLNGNYANTYFLEIYHNSLSSSSRIRSSNHAIEIHLCNQIQHTLPLSFLPFA